MTDEQLKAWIRPAYELLESMYDPTDARKRDRSGKALRAIQKARRVLADIHNEVYPEHPIDVNAVDAAWVKRARS